MALTTEQLRARAESLGLDFFIERRAGIWVKEWFNDGCTSATDEEVMMWSMLANREAQPTPELAAPSAGVYCPSDSAETIEKNPKSWAAWKREAERLQAIVDEVANRGAQPVAWHYPGSDGESRQLGYDDDLDSEQKRNCIPLYTAPPAPAVPVEIRNAYRAEGLAEVLKDAREYAPLTAEQLGTLVKNWHQTFIGLSGDANACSAAMLKGERP